jgi:peroxidase
MFGVPNKDSLRGLDVIDAAKTALEEACPDVVSCADIVAFAARDASFVLSNGKINFAMPAGRHDGRVSLASEANETALPGPFTDIQTIKSMFASKGLDTKDMVTLSGAHSVGHGRCGFKRNDADMNASLTRDQSDKCRRSGNNGTTVVQDYKTPHILDSQYYQNVKDNAVLFQSDAALNSGETKPLVDAFAADLSGNRWEADFAAAMVKMGKIGVKTSPGADAEIRKKCSIYN